MAETQESGMEEAENVPWRFILQTGRSTGVSQKMNAHSRGAVAQHGEVCYSTHSCMKSLKVLAA